MGTEVLIDDEEDLSNLPDPTPVLRSIAPGVVEVLAGVRNIDQLSSNLSENVYLKIRDRAASMARSRSESGEKFIRPDVIVKTCTTNHTVQVLFNQLFFSRPSFAPVRLRFALKCETDAGKQRRFRFSSRS